MSTIHQRRYLNCPYHRAKELLGDAVQAAATSGDAQLLRLELPIAPDAAVGKTVNVRFSRERDPMHFDQPWGVHWEPAGGGLYPTFDGTLTVRADENYESSLLELRGRYDPPLGLVGEAFDAIAGSRIAAATARELLRTIAERIEDRFAADEAAKSVR
jgi:hypothetical protein